MSFRGRQLTDSERARVLEFQDSIHYSPSHVMLPKAMLKVIPSDYFNSETGTLRILLEDEWRGIGITQSLGWEHYETHAPEPHILLFK
ncbi:CYFA0S06e02432g1_1 [Cyberlindnera fabianii]|uniref:Cyclin-dependent kinases regulatory subunit n=1 Tax=Cyberlindnera fabianii TaxID=36022 RepID=A0A061AU27_CYBFA|nr:CYFA0S06e02432g1_1 [Cyberlindnera fabianii]